MELMNGVTVVTRKKRKKGLDKALGDEKAGEVYEAEDVDDLFNQILN